VRHGRSTPLVRFLRNPPHALAHALSVLAHQLERLLPLALALLAAALALVVARTVLARLREQRLAQGARLLELAVPPELDPEGALLLWSSLHDLLRPRVARLFGGQPQLAWEIAADQTGSRFRLWVPAAVPPGLVERTLASAWPGITILDLTPPDVDVAETPSEAEAA
jgi:hypothetical protein